MIGIRPKRTLAAIIGTLGMAWCGSAFPQTTHPDKARDAAQAQRADAFVKLSGLPHSAVVSIKPEIVVGFRVAKNTWLPSEKIGLQGEVVDDAAADQLGYRSMRSLVEVNCETRRDRVVEMEVFALPNLKGVGQKRLLPGGWVQPSEDAYMADVIRAVCKRHAVEPGPKSPTGPAPAVKLDKPKIAAVPSPQAPIAAELRPLPLAPQTFTLQVGALDSEVAAHAALSKFSGLSGKERPTRIETINLDARTYYRALIDGFANRPEAQAYCAQVAKLHGPCLIRKSPDPH